MQKGVMNSYIDPESIQKNIFIVEINTITKFLLFRIKNIIDESGLFDD